jgi:hypothetical protein
MELLAWLIRYEIVVTWAGNLGTAVALLWAFYLARLDTQRAHNRATANILAADDALEAVQEYLERLADGLPDGGTIAFDDPRLTTTPFERFRAEMSEVSLADLPCQWTRRAVRRGRALVEAFALNVQDALGREHPTPISGEDLGLTLTSLQACREAMTPSLPQRSLLYLARLAFTRTRRRFDLASNAAYADVRTE